MGKQKVIWANDARHYHGFVHEPPISELDAVMPVDEVAGVGVDIFVYMVARADGLFYPSDVGQRWPNGERSMTHGAGDTFNLAAEWRVDQNLRSLEQRGLDPLKMLINRAHEHGMQFVASLRVMAYYGTDAAVAYAAPPDGIGFADPKIRAAQLAVVTELAAAYDSDGVELDLSGAPGGASMAFRPEDRTAMTPVMTVWVEAACAAVHGAPMDSASTVPRKICGARCYPTLEMNIAAGYDIPAWIAAGVDYLVPMCCESTTTDALSIRLRWNLLVCPSL